MDRAKGIVIILSVMGLAFGGCKKSGSSSGGGGTGGGGEPAAAKVEPAQPTPAKTEPAAAPTTGTPAPTPEQPAATPAAPQAQVCAGPSHTCALKPSGEVVCFGRNLDGQLGDGTAVDRPAPVPVAGISDAKAIACGDDFTCATRGSGGVSCWGQSYRGQLGNGSKDPTHVPVEVSGLSDAVEITAGARFACARRSNGHVSCWGEGSDGQLGNGATEGSATPVEVSGLEDAEQVAAGGAHTCARRRSGEVVCWGYGSSGELGQGEETSTSATPVAIAGLAGVRSVASGGSHSCAATESAVKCWGSNDNGALGNGEEGSGKSSGTPVDVADLSGAVRLALGKTRSCAVLESGDVKCWGYNNYVADLLHVGTEDRVAAKPAAVKDLSGVSTLAVGNDHACAIVGASKLVCWGYSDYGKMGLGDADRQPGINVVAEDVSKLAPAASQPYAFEPSPDAAVQVTPHIAVGSKHVCGVTGDGKVLCFGDGYSGQLGTGSTLGLGSANARAVPGITDAVQVAAAMDRTCALRANGRVACWGDVGDVDTSLPMPVEGVEDAAEIAVGGTSYGIVACVRHAGGAVSCWGQNNSGQLGNGTRDNSDTPVKVEGIDDAVKLVVTLSTACAVRSTGKVACWGSAYRGDLGNGTTDDSPTPVEVRGLSRVTDLAGGDYDFCAVHSGGKVSCWGSNSDGQIGNGKVDNDNPVTKPSEVRGVRNIVRVGVGGESACVVARDGSAMCWGANDFGQTGHDDAEADDVTRPWAVLNGNDETVKGFGGYVFLGCGTNHCCGLHVDGHVSCAGSTPIAGEGDFFGIGVVRSSVPAPAPDLQFPATTAP